MSDGIKHDARAELDSARHLDDQVDTVSTGSAPWDQW